MCCGLVGSYLLKKGARVNESSETEQKDSKNNPNSRFTDKLFLELSTVFISRWGLLTCHTSVDRDDALMFQALMRCFGTNLRLVG